MYMYCVLLPVYTCTVQLTRNLNASVEYEYERFYSRVSMCETRALEHSYSSFTRRPDPSHSSTRALVLELEHSSARTRFVLERSSSTRLELFARSNIVHEGTIIISMHAQELINSTPVRIWRMSVTDTRYVHRLCTVPLLGASNKAL